MRSFAAEIEFALMFTPSDARAKENAPKKRAARESQWDISSIGSQGIEGVLYRVHPAEEEAMPMNEMKVKITGRRGMYRSCHFAETRE